MEQLFTLWDFWVEGRWFYLVKWKNEIHGFVGEISQNRIGLRLDEIKKYKVGTFLGNCGVASVGECNNL